MKKVLPYMLLSFTLYSADNTQLPAKKELEMAATKSDISKRGHGTFADFAECLDPFFSPMVVGYAFLENVNTRDVLLGAALCGLVFQQLQIQGLIDIVDNNKKEQLECLNKLNASTQLGFRIGDDNFQKVNRNIGRIKKDMGLVERKLNEHRVGLNGHTQALKRVQSSVQKVASLTAKNDRNIEHLFNNQKNGSVRLWYLESQMRSVFQLIRGSEPTVYRKTHR